MVEYVAVILLGAAVVAGGASVLQRAITALRAARRGKE